MVQVKLGNTGIVANKNGFGALPIQRIDKESAVRLIHMALRGGVNFFDTARAYSDSEEKLGAAFAGIDRGSYYLATKTAAKTGEQLRTELAVSLNNLRTDYVDIYQLHCAPKCFRPEDADGVYAAALEAKKEGKIKHIGITAHLLNVAQEAVESGLYETLQFPFAYISGEQEIALVKKCADAGMGFLGMKGLAGGLLTNSKLCYWFACQYESVLPLWGVQRESELAEFLSYQDNPPVMDDEMKAVYEKDLKELSGDFCRGCGYCMPCPKGIQINNCARISQLLRRSPSKNWLSEEWQANMAKIKECIHCNQCASKCPYGLDTPKLLEKNLEDYENVVAGKVQVD
ncbi:aldo/keto reductase [Lachnospiraceae bacterium MD335]|jgi:predicted aldo/keto reductase-like oxidoreductase|nr:aldo/keto reductase [Lachnospiraceae bacterium MD335]